MLWVGIAAATAATVPLIAEHLPITGPADVRMEVVSIPPAKSSTATTTGLPGHSHRGATYVYVLSGRVLSRLGSGPELPFSSGQAWSEAPGQAHYMVNASATEPASLLVTFVVPSGTTRFTQPFDPDRSQRP